jgi:hypothetical protein
MAGDMTDDQPYRRRVPVPCARSFAMPARRGRTSSIHGPAVAAGAPAFTGAPREAGQAAERDGFLFPVVEATATATATRASTRVAPAAARPEPVEESRAREAREYKTYPVDVDVDLRSARTHGTTYTQTPAFSFGHVRVVEGFKLARSARVTRSREMSG